MEIAKHVAVLVRHHDLLGRAGPDLLAADDDRDVDGLARHLVEAGLELGARGRARRVGQVGIVLGTRHPAAAGKDIRHERFLWNEGDLHSKSVGLSRVPGPSPEPTVTIRPCAAGLVLLTAWFVLRLATPLACRADRARAVARRSSTAAISSFLPTNTSTSRASREGFNIHLIRALAREAGMSVEVRLGPREERMREFDAGKTDVMFLSYTEERAARYQLLDQTWTLAQVVMMRPGLPRYPHGLDDLWGVRIAVDQNSINHQLLAALPESRRPTLTVVATREDEIRAFERGEVDGVAGNHLTMRFLMGRAGRKRGRSAADLAAVSARRAARAARTSSRRCGSRSIG